MLRFSKIRLERFESNQSQNKKSPPKPEGLDLYRDRLDLFELFGLFLTGGKDQNNDHND